MAMQQHMMQKQMEAQLTQVMQQQVQVMEQQLDQENKRLDAIVNDEDALEKIRERRLKELKSMAEKKAEYRRQGHGSLNEINSDRDFMDAAKGSQRVVVHFYRNTTMNCKVLDKHLIDISQRHLETKFLKVDVEKCDWLVKRLNVRIIPTMAIMLKGTVQTYIRGFEGFGDDGKDFPTAMLEWRLGQVKAITYKGDLSTPPDCKKGPQPASSKIIRGKQNEAGGYSDEESDGLSEFMDD